MYTFKETGNRKMLFIRLLLETLPNTATCKIGSYKTPTAAFAPLLVYGLAAQLEFNIQGTVTGTIDNREVTFS